MSVTTNIDAVVRANRMRAVSRTIIQGGEAGRKLAQQANASGSLSIATVEVDGVEKQKFVPGLHPVDQSGLYIIP